MSENVSYNGVSGQRKFHKLRKYADIFQNVISFGRQRREIEKIGNPLLSDVLNSIQEVKNSKFNKSDKRALQLAKSYRDELLKNSDQVSYEIFGSSAKKQVRNIYKVSASPKIWGELLYSLSKNLKSKKVLEIGTNVGVSGTYLLHGLSQNYESFKFVTMEGLDQLCSLCRLQFSKITSSDNFDVVSGLYDDTFPKMMEREEDFDLIFIDGNHQKEPTLEYFRELQKCIKDKAVFIFDDIYYNIDMTNAWNILLKDKNVNFSIDLYKWGIIIIDKSEKVKNREFSIHVSHK